MRYSLLPTNQNQFARYLAAAATQNKDDVRPMQPKMPVQGFPAGIQARRTAACA